MVLSTTCCYAATSVTAKISAYDWVHVKKRRSLIKEAALQIVLDEIHPMLESQYGVPYETTPLAVTRLTLDGCLNWPRLGNSMATGDDCTTCSLSLTMSRGNRTPLEQREYNARSRESSNQEPVTRTTDQ